MMAKEFERLFQGYMHYHNSNNIIPRIPQTAQTDASISATPATSEKISLSSYSSIVLAHLPNMYKVKGKLLLHNLRNAGVN